MKATMKLTFDGLARALRSRLHQMAEEIETGYRRGGDPIPQGRQRLEAIRIEDDDVSGH